MIFDAVVWVLVLFLRAWREFGIFWFAWKLHEANNRLKAEREQNRLMQDGFQAIQSWVSMMVVKYKVEGP